MVTKASQKCLSQVKIEVKLCTKVIKVNETMYKEANKSYFIIFTQTKAEVNSIDKSVCRFGSI